MKRFIVGLICVVFVTSLQAYSHFYAMPPMSYVRIVSHWSDTPWLYIDEFGNTIVMNYCAIPQQNQFDLPPKFFSELVDDLHALEFLLMPPDAGFSYKKNKKGKSELGETVHCSHCSEIYVTYKYADDIKQVFYENIDSVPDKAEKYKEINKLVNRNLAKMEAYIKCQERR